MAGDYRDLCIEELSNSEARLIDRVASLEADVQAYRLVAVQAIHGLHDLQRRLEQQQRRSAHLRAEIERLTAAVVTKQKAWAA